MAANRLLSPLCRSCGNLLPRLSLLPLSTGTHARRCPSPAVSLAAGYATGTKKGTAPSGSRSAVKVKINKKDDGGKGTPGGPDPGRLVNPEYIAAQPMNLSSIPELEPSQITDSNVGKPFKLSPRTMKALETLTIPSSIAKDWKATLVPVTTLRKASVALVSRLAQAKSTRAEQSPVLTLIGQAGTGKSTVMLHAVSYAIQQQWIVLYIPDARSLVDGQYGYEYCPRTELYHQNVLSASILSKLLAINDLNGLSVTKPRTLIGTLDERVVESEEVPIGLALGALVRTGIQQVHFAPTVLEIVVDELAAQTVRPVLIGIDGAQNLFKTSEYVDGSFRALDSFVLNVPRLLVELARGSRTLAKGLTILAASSQHAPTKSLAWDAAVIEGKAPSGRIWPGWAAYGDLAQPIAEFTRLEVEKLDRVEAAGVARGLEVTKQILGPLSDRIFVRHYVCADGNAREFRREIESQAAF